ncbi:hypothetical protein HYX04_00510 [Candidatus Woesearchaeota archaeon]|nr:hypothetical protein [Candidatus Woesearchaeota archaeon]
MSIDDLTDSDFWNAYTDPKLGKLFEPYLLQDNAHPSQKGQPGYNSNNRQWYAEAKKDPKIIETIKNLKAEKVAALKQQSKTSSSGGLFNLTQRQSVVGLAAILAGVALLAGMPYLPPPLY